MLALTPRPTLKIELTALERHRLLTYLNILNGCTDADIEKYINTMLTSFDLPTALFFAITQVLPTAFQRLWDNGASAFHLQIFQLNGSFRLRESENPNMKGSGHNYELLFAAMVSVKLALYRKNVEEIDAAFGILADLIKKGGSWNEAHLLSLFECLTVINDKKFPEGTTARFVTAILQENILGAIEMTSERFLLEPIIKSPIFDENLLNLLYAHPIVKAAFDKAYGADKDLKLKPLHLAARNGIPEIVAFILKLGLDVNQTDSENWTALHIAVACGASLDTLEAILKAGADINARNNDGFTALHLAVSCGDVPVNDSTPYAISADKEYVEPDELDSASLLKPVYTESHIEYDEHRREIVTWLLEHDVDITIDCNSKLNALEWAAFVNNIQAVNQIIAHAKAKGISCCREYGIDIIFRRTRYSFMEQGKNVDRVSIMRLLMQQGVRREFKYRGIEQQLEKGVGRIPLNKFSAYYWLSGAANAADESIIAIRCGEKEEIKSLLASETLDREWLFEALANAIAFDQVEIVSLLLEFGVNPCGDFHGYSLLHLSGASENPNIAVSIATLLIQNNILADCKLMDMPLIKETFTSTQLQSLGKIYKNYIKAKQTVKVIATSDTVEDIGTSVPALKEKDAEKVIVNMSDASAKKLSAVDIEYIAQLLAALNETLTYTRMHLDNKEIVEARDALDSLQYLLRKLALYRDHSRTYQNEYNRYLKQYNSLCERIDERFSTYVTTPGSPSVFPSKKTNTKSLAPSVMGGAGDKAISVDSIVSAVTLDFSKEVIDKKKSEEDSVVTVEMPLMQQKAQSDLLSRIQVHLTAIDGAEGSLTEGLHYNLIRLFELWSERSEYARILRQHLLHSHYRFKPAVLIDLARTIITYPSDGSIDLNRFIQDLTCRKDLGFYKIYVVDARSPEELMKAAYCILDSLATIYNDIKPKEDTSITAVFTDKATSIAAMCATLDKSPILADTVRMHFVKLGELLRDGKRLSVVRTNLCSAESSVLDVASFCAEVCRARNAACHTHNIKSDDSTEGFKVQETLPPKTLLWMMEMAFRISQVIKVTHARFASPASMMNLYNATKSATDSTVFSP